MAYTMIAAIAQPFSALFGFIGLSLAVVPLVFAQAPAGAPVETPLSSQPVIGWRGILGGGVTPDETRLVLPESGAAPTWLTSETLPVGNLGGWSSPIVSDSAVFLFVHEKRRVEEGLSYRELVFCWDRQTGTLNWRYERTSQETRFPLSGTPLLSDERLYVVGAVGTLYCLDASSGELIWLQENEALEATGTYHSSPATRDGVLAVYLGRLCGFDCDSGDLLWSVETHPFDEGQSSPIGWEQAGEAMFICHTGDERTLCVAARTGETRWEIESQASASTPFVWQDRLIVYGRGRSQGVAAYDLRSSPPELLWRTRSFGDSGSSPTFVDDKLVVQGGRELGCLRLATGEILWREQLDLQRPRYTSLVANTSQVIYAFDGLMIFEVDDAGPQQTMRGKIMADGWLGSLDAVRAKLELPQLEQTLAGRREAQRRWQEQVELAGPLPCCTPTIADGFLFVRLRDKLACYDLRTAD